MESTLRFWNWITFLQVKNFCSSKLSFLFQKELKKLDLVLLQSKFFPAKFFFCTYFGQGNFGGKKFTLQRNEIKFFELFLEEKTQIWATKIFNFQKLEKKYFFWVPLEIHKNGPTLTHQIKSPIKKIQFQFWGIFIFHQKFHSELEIFIFLFFWSSEFCNLNFDGRNCWIRNWRI